MSLNSNNHNWIDCTLGDIVTFKRGYDLPKDKMNKGKYPVVGSNGIIGYHDEFTTESPGITVGRSGNVGNPFIVKGDSWSHNTTLFVEKFKNVDPYFVYYYLKTIDLKQFAGGSAVPTLNRNHIHPIDIRIPRDINEQKKISTLLLTIDEKIAVCESINKNLAALAKTIFRDRFIFYKGYESQMIKTDVGEIPNTFEVKSVDEISKDVVCGKTPSTKVEENYGDKMPFITIPDMHGNVFVIDTERKLSEIGIKSQIKKILPENSICVSCIATAGLVSLTSEESQTNQQINSVICKEGISPYFVYLYMEELSEYIKMLGSGGSTTLNLNKREFGKIELVIPPQEDMIEFHKQISPIFEEIKTNQYEIEKLTKLRDTLLPKLMSGEIDVSQINCDLQITHKQNCINEFTLTFHNNIIEALI
ncbi:restriction endonuclease subunit S [uncultured Methanobrevibacter sp.]|uniref:restriction endonuclease subunit S n=1 Tax=uncultured Methanobrevibacter sp. TaxID=253161 RepID=UPI0025F4150A|nr:restriction endonuclease subunit S [uncultured Methanobrevibacter sp.]